MSSLGMVAGRIMKGGAPGRRPHRVDHGQSGSGAPQTYTRSGLSANGPDGYAPPSCPRCGGVVRVDWVDVADSGPVEWVVWETACLTPGCVDAEGWAAGSAPVKRKRGSAHSAG